MLYTLFVVYIVSVVCSLITVLISYKRIKILDKAFKQYTTKEHLFSLHRCIIYACIPILNILYSLTYTTIFTTPEEELENAVKEFAQINNIEKVK